MPRLVFVPGAQTPDVRPRAGECRDCGTYCDKLIEPRDCLRMRCPYLWSYVDGITDTWIERLRFTRRDRDNIRYLLKAQEQLEPEYRFGPVINSRTKSRLHRSPITSSANARPQYCP